MTERLEAGSRAGDAHVESGFLERMVALARQRVAQGRLRAPLRRPPQPLPGGRLLAALRATSSGALGLIAEVKRSSPSRGAIAPQADAVERARLYACAGATAVSVLTEPTVFCGSVRDLSDVARAVPLPVLRKDFVVDAYQIWEAAEAGAAAILLIAAALPGDQLERLLEECHACGLDALVEVHDEDDMARAIALGCPLVGINNRDLTTLRVDIAVTERLAPNVPAGTVIVAESGIRAAGDARRAALAGAHALLVGEALMDAAPDALNEVVGGFRRPFDSLTGRDDAEVGRS